MPNTPWTPRPLTLALAQFAMDEEPSVNLDKALTAIQQAASRNADIVCLPELFRSPYFCRNEHSPRDYSEPVPGVTGAALSKAAQQHNVAVIGGSVYERTAENKLFNTALVIDKQGKILGSYRKMHIPEDPSFYERSYFAEGDTGFKVFDLGVARIAVLICYDQWFPEAARLAVLAGAEILFYPTAIGTVDGVPQVEGDWQLAWETVQRGHAVANSVVVATVNRVGREGASVFWGGSFVCNAFGKLLTKGTDREELLVTTVDLGHSTFTRESWRFFESRRPDAYGEITKRGRNLPLT